MIFPRQILMGFVITLELAPESGCRRRCKGVPAFLLGLPFGCERRDFGGPQPVRRGRTRGRFDT
jgi:hypothetical protein